MTATQRFANFTAVAMPLLRSNVDTDAIIPSREIKSVDKRGLAPGLFAGWRYLNPDARIPDPKFILNDSAYSGVQILLSGNNFGCGSSREHAVWALQEYGIRAIFAPSFAPIFQGNCLRNGLLAGCLSEPALTHLAALIVTAPQATRLHVDLGKQQLRLENSATGVALCVDFGIDPETRAQLLSGRDAIDLTFASRAAIGSYLASDRVRRPWVYLKATP